MMKNVAGKMATFSLLSLLLLLFFSFPHEAMASEGKADLSILSESPAVGRRGQWKAEVEITNESGVLLSSGLLEARSSTSPVSSLPTMNLWATGHMNLSTPVLLAEASTPSLQPGSSFKAILEGSGESLGAQWGARPLEFFFASSSNGSQMSCSLNSFVTLTSASTDLPSLPLSLLYVNPGPTKASRKGSQSLIDTGEGKVLLQTQQTFPPSLKSEEKIQIIEDGRADQEFKNASALEQPAQLSISYLGGMQKQVKEWQGDEDLPKILVSSSSLSASQLEEGLSLGYKAALEEGGKSQTISLPEGKLTLLSSSPLLSSLAGGTPSSAWAQAEQTEAGREARFIAQIAAMRGIKSPLIVEASPSSLPILSFLSGEKWINFKTIGEDLAWQWPSSSPSLPQTNTQEPISSPLPQVSLFSSLSTDAKPAEAWAKAVENEADYAQLCSHSQNNNVRGAGQEALSYMQSDLNRCLNLSVSNKITVLSESVSLPVTIKNSLPFPVKAKVRSLASNAQITILPEKESQVGSKMESQIDFPVQIHSSIRGAITFWIGGFYHPVTKISTQLNSHLTVTRLNVTILIIPAGLLTLFGCIRQVRRKKKNG